MIIIDIGLICFSLGNLVLKLFDKFLVIVVIINIVNIFIE